jgi:CheY-like chemotaxis protein
MLAIQRIHPDVIVSDIGMPGRDGYGFIRSVRSLPLERDRHTPAIALTAYGSPEDRSRALQLGFDVHLTKPADSARLIQAVAALALKRHARRGDGNGFAAT